VSKLASALSIRRGEGRSLAPALAYSFLAMGALGLSTIAADSLFVSTFDLGTVSHFYAVGAVVRVAAALAYAALSRRVARAGPAVGEEGRHARLDRAVLGATALVLVASGALAFRANPAAIYAINVALLVLPPLLPLMAFNAAMSCFHARQAKRLLPLVAAAASVGFIVVGAGATLLATAVGTPSLLFFAAVMCLAAAPLPVALAKAAAAGAPESAPPPSSETASSENASTQAPTPAGLIATVADTARDVRHVPIVRQVVLYAFFIAAAGSFVDFAFKAALKEAYDRDGMAAAFGTFNLVANAAILVAQIGLTSRFVGRFGLRAALSSGAASVAVLAPLLALFPGVWAATATKLAEMVTRYALGNASSDLLLTPTDRDVRTRAKIVVKGAASPLGALGAGIVLASFGAEGPPDLAMAALVVGSALLLLAALVGSKKAYTEALARALGRGQISLDVSPNVAAVLRSELSRMLAEAAARGDARTAGRTLAIMSDRFFTVRDVLPALESPHPEIAQEAVETALRIARPGDGAALLEICGPRDDDAAERRLLAGARALGGLPDAGRLARAKGRAAAVEPSREAIDLWAEALIAEVEIARRERAAGSPDAEAMQARIDAAVKQLRKAALGEDGPRRRAALRALGDLREKRAEREILKGMGSSDAEVFAEAARSAVLIDASGAIPSLVLRLSAGPHVPAAARALSLAGPAAVNELIQALPTTRGEGAALPTAIATEHSVTGTVRAARVLARLGPEACTRVLSRFGELGYRARNAVTRALTTVDEATRVATAPELVESAMDLVLTYAERLTVAWPHAALGRFGGRGMLAREISHRLSETSERILDLASVLHDKRTIAKARAALSGGERDKQTALELLDNILPAALAARTVTVLEHEAAAIGSAKAWSAAPPGPESVRGVREGDGAPAFDGWLEKCRQFDLGTLPSEDPMFGVLEKVLILRDSSLFVGLSGEELYPVAEIAASRQLRAGETVVRQGDPGDALYVVAEGTFSIVKSGGAKAESVLRSLSAGEVFGEMALLDGSPRAATVRAATDGAVLRIPRAEFEALLDQSPELARGVIRTLIGHLRAIA
jgi:hypothetical protein